MKVVQARGSFRKVGQSVGEATREVISFMRLSIVPDLLHRSFGGDELRMIREGRRHLHELESFFPEGAEYVLGLAEGASISFDKLLPLTFLEEMSIPLSRDRCSTLLVRTDQGWLVGHQEDYKEIFYGRLAVLDLHLKDYPRLVSLAYPGTFPGMATSLNSLGVAMTCNALWPEPVSGSGQQAKHFLASLEGSMLGALSWICAGPHTLTDHFLVIDGQKDLASTIEVTSRPEAPFKEQIREIVWEESRHDGESILAPFTHANHIKLLEPWVSGMLKDPAHQGSAMRQRKLDHIARICPPSTPEEMLALFCKKDGVLNRDSNHDKTGQPNSVSIATTVIRPNTGEIWFVEYGKGDETPLHIAL